MPRNKIFFTTVIALYLILLPGPQSWPQEPSTSQVSEGTKELDRAVPEEEIKKKLVPTPEKPPEIEKKIEEEKPEGPAVFVKEVKLLGVESLAEEYFTLILEKYENRTVAFSELQALAKEIEKAYLEAGIIAACFLLPQEIKEGVVILQVVEARMGKLIINGSRYFSKRRLTSYWRIKPGEVLQYDEISRSLQLMNKNPDRFVTAGLHAGEEPGTTDVILNSEERFPIHATLSLDREGAVSTGRIRKGLGFINNNFLGFDDMLLGGYVGGKNFGGVYLYHKIPITNFGTSFLYGYSQTRAFPKKDFETFEMSSHSETASASVHQDLFYEDEYKGEVKLALEANDRNVAWSQGTLNKDKLRIIRVGGFFVDKKDGSVASFKPEFSQGINYFGARRRNELSSRGASNTFSKPALFASFKKVLFANLTVNMKFEGQFAFEKLMPQEELYLGGIDSVRGYPNGDYLADTGFYSNLELLVPAFFLPKNFRIPYGKNPLRDEITGLVFFDYGYGRKRASETEISKRELASLGLGIRVKLFDQALLRLEWGWPLDTMANWPLTEFSHSRFHFSFSFQDKIIDEIERIFGLFKAKNI